MSFTSMPSPLRPRDARFPFASQTARVQLMCDAGSAVAEVRNVSRRGACIATAVPLEPGITVTLRGEGDLEGACAAATVAWLSDGTLGLRIQKFLDEKSENLWLDVLEVSYRQLRAVDVMEPADRAEATELSVSHAATLTEVLGELDRCPRGVIAVKHCDEVIGCLDAAVMLPWIKAIERLRQEKQKRQFSRLMSLAVHDLANPVAAAYSTVQLLTAGFVTTEQFVEEGLAQVVEKNCERALAEIEDLLTIARDEAGMMRLHKTRFDVAALVAEVGQSHLARARVKDIELSWQTPDELWCEGDRGKIQRVLANLVSNALKFTHATGLASLVARAVCGGIEISVKDNGIGIESHDLSRLFDPFNRLSAHPTSGEASHGIGLAVSRSIVVAHGGKIRVNSRPGVGSTFTVFLPQSSKTSG